MQAIKARKNTKAYYIAIIRTNAGEVIEQRKHLEGSEGLRNMCYDEAYRMLDYFGLSSGKRYKLDYLKEEAEYSEKLLETFYEGKNVHNLL